MAQVTVGMYFGYSVLDVFTGHAFGQMTDSRKRYFKVAEFGLLPTRSPRTPSNSLGSVITNPTHAIVASLCGCGPRIAAIQAELKQLKLYHDQQHLGGPAGAISKSVSQAGKIGIGLRSSVYVGIEKKFLY